MMWKTCLVLSFFFFMDLCYVQELHNVENMFYTFHFSSLCLTDDSPVQRYLQLWLFCDKSIRERRHLMHSLHEFYKLKA